MAISIYDLSVTNYLQVLDAMNNVLAKGADYASENGLDLDEITQTRLRDDMLPFSFQIVSVVHHSLGAMEGLKAGLFGPPPSVELDYAGLQALLSDAAAGLRAMSRDDIEALEGNPVMFKMGDFELPFVAEDFLMSFSLPNVHFHATTAYGILRMLGVPLGKLDFLGAVRVAS